jgi:hypothetical protein
MKTNKLLVAAALATAIGTPIAGFVGEMKGQPTTSTGVRVPFLQGFFNAQPAGQSELAALAQANEWLNSPPLTLVGSARKSRPHRFLDLHLHQLAAHASLCPRLGREISESRVGGDRHTRTRVRI